MACRTESKMINEREFDVTQWPVEKAILMKMKLVKAFGASLAKLAGEDASSETDALSEGLSTLFDSNSPEEIVALMKSCVVGVALDGKRITETSFNEVFETDDLMDIYQVFLFVIKVNYGNLLKGQLADRFLAKMKENL